MLVYSALNNEDKILINKLCSAFTVQHSQLFCSHSECVSDLSIYYNWTRDSRIRFCNLWKRNQL